MRFFRRVPQSFDVTFHGPGRVEIHEHGVGDTTPADESPPSLPLLTRLTKLEPTDWLRESLTTFAKTVSSFLPGHFPAYARVYHTFDRGDGSFENSSTWRAMTAQAGIELNDRETAADFALGGVADAQARLGTLRLRLIDILIEHLRPATAAPDLCYFAVWEGFGGLAVPMTLTPKLELPNRAYHVFSGPLTAARTSYDNISWGERSANLWWPADQAWCVATEVDLAWTYVGASRACIDAILADPRLEVVETTALSLW